jgi:WD40 repeat protein
LAPILNQLGRHEEAVATLQQALELVRRTGIEERRLASASADTTAKVWDVTTGQATLTLEASPGIVWGVAFSPDGRRLASASGAPGKPGEVNLWDAHTGRVILTLKEYTGPAMGAAFSKAGTVLGVAFSPDGRLARASADGTVKVWDATPDPEASR